MELGHSNWEGWNNPDEAGEWSWSPAPRDLSVGSKTMPTRNLAMNLDVDEVLEDLLPGNLTAALMQQWGEEVVDLDVGLGTDPELARMKSYSSTWEVPMHAEIVCKRGGVFDLEREMHDSATIPVEIVWLGVGQEPGDGWRDAVLPEPEREPEPPTPPEPADVPLTSQTWVTQAHLSVIPDPADPCRINLSGVVVANGETDVEYRFVDELGLHTQTFTTSVDQTFTAFLDHHIVLEPVPADGPGGGGGGGQGFGLVAEGDGGIGGLTHGATDNQQGLFRLEVLGPNHLVSDVASYNVADCVQEPPGPVVVAPTTTTPPPPPSGLTLG